MKLQPRDVKRWLSKPLAVGGVLVHGEDRGHAAEIAAQIATALVPDLSDPFAVAQLDADSLRGDPSRLSDELGAIRPGGGVRLVRLRDATDRHSVAIEEALAAALPPAQAPQGGAVLLVEAGELFFRSSLRKLFEGRPDAASIQCGLESDAALAPFIRETLGSDGIKIGDEALALLVRRLAPDRAQIRQTLEALALYKLGDGPHTELSLADIQAASGDAESLGIEAVMDAVLSGARERIDRAVAKALAGGAAPVALLRASLRLFQRVALVSALMSRGANAERALSALTPPVPFGERDPFLAACRRWSGGRATHALRLIDRAEIRCKTTGLPEDVICAETLLRLSDLAAAGARA